ncbi:MAG: type II toxin-antitoxin system HicA family toxin [Spirochaetales bacterium]|nr:type II toxin-antitoxin system HicA family toxin [Spirochaetales bacterium]
MSKQKLFSAAEVIKILSNNDFELISQKGSHQKWKNFNSGCQVIIPFHKGKQLPIGTLKSIIEGSGLDSEIWK